MPEARTMRKLAKGLGVDPEAVGLAVLETMGIIPRKHAQPRLLQQLPARETLDRLTQEDIDTVVGLVKLLAGRRGPARAHAPQPRAGTRAHASPNGGGPPPLDRASA